MSQTFTDIKLPEVRGRYNYNYNLSQMTWFRVGGPTDILFKPADTEDLSFFLKNRPQDLPVVCIGAGSNVLVRDHGIRGCVIRLTGSFAAVHIDNNVVIAGAGALDRTVVMHCRDHSLTGLEFLVGIPGTIGGAIAMNAGAYGSEIKDFLEWVEILDAQGQLLRLYPKDLQMSYRDGNLPKNSLVIRAAFTCAFAPQEQIQHNIDTFLKQREETQPVRGRTGGSTFKNPMSRPKAWELIDKAGCRGLKIGDAQISEKHCNFLLNLDSATAKELETLGEQVRQQVKQTSDVDLEWEIIRLGD